jgi:hypothetical protein
MDYLVRSWSPLCTGLHINRSTAGGRPLPRHWLSRHPSHAPKPHYLLQLLEYFRQLHNTHLIQRSVAFIRCTISLFHLGSSTLPRPPRFLSAQGQIFPTDKEFYPATIQPYRSLPPRWILHLHISHESHSHLKTAKQPPSAPQHRPTSAKHQPIPLSCLPLPRRLPGLASLHHTERRSPFATRAREQTPFPPSTSIASPASHARTPQTRRPATTTAWPLVGRPYSPCKSSLPCSPPP